VEPILLGVNDDIDHDLKRRGQGVDGVDENDPNIDSVVTSPYALSVGQGSIGTLSNLSRARRSSGLRIRTPIGDERPPAPTDARERQPPQNNNSSQASGALQLREPPSNTTDINNYSHDGKGRGGGGGGSGGEAAEDEDLTVIIGARLESRLVKEISDQINGGRASTSTNASAASSSSVPVDMALIHLGLDSLSLTQLQGMLQHEYKIAIPDELVFSEETTIKWIVDHEKFLRGRVPWPASTIANKTTSEKGGATNNVSSSDTNATAASGMASDTTRSAASSSAQDMQTSTRRRSNGGGRGGGGGGGEASFVSDNDTNNTSTGTVVTRRPTPLRRPRRQPSMLETNCPCFLICFSD